LAVSVLPAACRRWDVRSTLAGIAVVVAVAAAAVALSPLKRAASAVFLVGGVAAFVALAVLAVLLETEFTDMVLESYLRILVGPVLMIVPGVLSVRTALKIASRARTGVPQLTLPIGR
jgi:hypothetical protein